MTFHPCPCCRRHIRRGEPSCVFCGASSVSAVDTGPRVTRTRTRLGRAAVFAGATLTACWTSTARSPDHVDQHADHRDTDSDPQGDAHQFAQPPDATRTASITGTVTNSTTGQPLSGITVNVAGSVALEVVTDDHGVYRVPPLPDGEYVIIVQGVSNHPRRQAPVQRFVVRVAGKVVVQDIELPVYVPPKHDPNNMPMPYGAPPARRRVV